MKPTPILLPPHLTPRIATDLATRFIGIGNPALLAEPLLGLIASRQCPGHVFIETLERAPQWAKAGRVLVSGFHSPLEQQVLHSLLRRQGRAVKVLARHLLPDRDYRPAAEEREPWHKVACSSSAPAPPLKPAPPAPRRLPATVWCWSLPVSIGRLGLRRRAR